jgi:hypothetical protein
LIPARKKELDEEIVGGHPADNPDNSVGSQSRDFSSLSFLGDAYENLFDAVESADAAPTPDMLAAQKKLDTILKQTLVRLDAYSSPSK